MSKEWLITGQGYEKTDSSKQTILLHETLMAACESTAKEQFNAIYNTTHHIIRIYSIMETALLDALISPVEVCACENGRCSRSVQECFLDARYGAL